MKGDGKLRIQLDDLINKEKLQKMQDHISQATDMALLTVDFKGVPITEHSNCKAFCLVMRNHPQSRDMCQKCDSRGGIEAARLEKPYIYICHQGLVDLAVPIISQGQYLGAIMAGQVQLANSKDQDLLEHMHMRMPIEHEEVLDKKIVEYKNNLPSLSLEKIKSIGNMLFDFAELITHQDLEAKLVTEKLKAKRRTDDVGITYSELKPIVNPEDIPPNPYPFLKPAFNMLAQSSDHKLSVEEMAMACNVSVNYFSKCFSKTTGMRFAAYQNQLKVQEAEKLLKTTNRTVTEISDNLGFESPSYFIKCFKQLLGVTPSNYRQRYMEKMKIDHHTQIT